MTSMTIGRSPQPERPAMSMGIELGCLEGIRAAGRAAPVTSELDAADLKPRLLS